MLRRLLSYAIPKLVCSKCCLQQGCDTKTNLRQYSLSFRSDSQRRLFAGQPIGLSFNLLLKLQYLFL